MKGPNREAQMPLFWVEPPCRKPEDLLGKIKWSYSRRTVLEQCPRRYFYEYYGSKVPRKHKSPDAQMVRFLKSLQNRHERAGTIAHLVISTYFRKIHSGIVLEPDRLRRWAAETFRRDCIHSQTNPGVISQSTERFPPVLLQEYYFQLPDAPKLCSESEKQLVDGVYNFATNPSFSQFRNEGAKSDSLIENHLSIKDLPCHAEGKLDLVFSVGRSRVVVDWKLGAASHAGNDSLQLAGYALWASQFFDTEPEMVTVCTAHLATCEIVYFPITEQILTNARSRIIQDAERMAALHDYGIRGVEDAFTPCEQKGVCKLCPFQKLCPEGRAVLHA